MPVVATQMKTEKLTVIYLWDGVANVGYANKKNPTKLIVLGLLLTSFPRGAVSALPELSLPYPSPAHVLLLPVCAQLPLFKAPHGAAPGSDPAMGREGVRFSTHFPAGILGFCDGDPRGETPRARSHWKWPWCTSRDICSVPMSLLCEYHAFMEWSRREAGHHAWFQDKPGRGMGCLPLHRLQVPLAAARPLPLLCLLLKNTASGLCSWAQEQSLYVLSPQEDAGGQKLF